MLQNTFRARTMATTPLTDQERALLAQFVASNTSDPANAPILVQYVMDRFARGGSTLAEVVAQLSPNGLDASADYGPYLDVVNRTLAPEAAPSAPAGDGGSGGSSSDYYESSAAPSRAIIPGPNPIPGMWEAYKSIFTGQPPTEPIVAPSRVHVASLDPLPGPIPDVELPFRPEPAPVAEEPYVPMKRPDPVQPAMPPLPRSDPRPAPIPEAAAPTQPQAMLPVLAPPSNVRQPAPSASDMVRGSNGWETIASIPTTTQGPTTRSVPTVSAAPRDLISDSFSRIDAANQPSRAVPTDLIERTLASITSANRPSGPFTAGEDLARNPVRGRATPSLADAGYSGPVIDAAYTDFSGPGFVNSGARQFTEALPNLPSNGITLDANDRELLARAVATEVDPRIARSNPEAYALQVQRVTDTILNRVASPQYPNSVAAVLNQDRQFSAIAGPTGRPGERYGTVQNIPASRADNGLRDIINSHVDQRVAGEARSSVAGGLNYANPGVSDLSNLDWVNKLNYAVDDAGPFSHRYGVAGGGKPVEATFANPSLDAINSLAAPGSFTLPTLPGAPPPPRPRPDDNKRIAVKADPIAEMWTAPATGSRDQVEQRSAGQQVAKTQQAAKREPITQAWTQPQSSASDRVRMAQAASRTSSARSAAAPSRTAASNSGGSNSGFSYAGSSSGSSNSGFSYAGSSGSSYSGSNSGSTGSRTSTGSTSGSSKSSTTPSKSYTGASDSVRGNSSPSKSTYTGASDSVRGNSSPSKSSSSDKYNGYSYNPSGR